MTTFLVALDSSTRAPQVLASAVTLARAAGAKLILLRSVGLPTDLPIEAYAMSPDGVLNVLEERAKKELTELARGLPPGTNFEVCTAVGAAWQTICQAAHAAGAALIVIGSHGYGGLDRLLCTTAAKVVNHADRSVLVVRAPELIEGIASG
jgi:universal stress protein F